MYGKLSRLQELPHSKDEEKVSSPRDSVTSRYPCPAQIGSANIFLPLKAVSLSEPQILIFRGVHCHPKEGGMISYRFSERHCHCSECKWAEELNRWLQ